MELKEILVEAGVEYEKVLERFSGNSALLRKFICRFPQDDTYGQLQAAMDRQNLGEVEMAAHTLKGVCANLGFDALSELCNQMVRVARGQEEGSLAALFAQVTQEYQRVLHCIEEIC